jgi:RNA polymerase sigma-70 factor (ECF subfamily)
VVNQRHKRPGTRGARTWRPRFGGLYEGISATGQRGDVRSLSRSASELFRERAPFVARQLTRLGVPGAELDDAVQEVFLVVFRRGGFAEGPASETTFLTEVAVRVAANVRRRGRRKPTVSDEAAIAAVPSRAGDPLVSAEVQESLERVASALEQLKPEARLVFLLVEVEGASADDVALALGVPTGTVYSRAHAARRAFRAAYERVADSRRPKGLFDGLRLKLGLPRLFGHREEPAR